MSLIKDEDIEEDPLKKTWLLVQWAGSFTEDSYDIINGADVVFDEYSDMENVTVGSTIMVRCGRMKSPALVQEISENTDALFDQLKKLQRLVLKETSVNIIKSSTPKAKKRRREADIVEIKKYENKGTQTEDNTIAELMQENQKLKAELYESNKIINTICKDLRSVLQGTQKKLQSYGTDTGELDESDGSFRENSPRSTSKSPDMNLCPFVEQNDKVLIGSSKTAIPRYIFNQVNWLSFTAATRKLLMAVFPRDVLATHSLTGKPSPAFMSCDMPTKMKLDSSKVSDIVEIVSYKCNVSESMVRSAITTKCADENKMFKKRMEKKKDKINCDE